MAISGKIEKRKGIIAGHGQAGQAKFLECWRLETMIIRVAAWCIATLFFVGLRGPAADEAQCSQGDGECLASLAEQGHQADDPGDPPLPADTPISVQIQNHSPYRADVHFDDGRFGKVSGTVDSGDTIRLSSFPGHRFFVTRHGVRDGLVDPTTDDQYYFQVNSDDRLQVFTIPREGSPSKTRCKDRYPVCAQEAARGECVRNPGWMIVNCCGSCDEKEGYGELIDSSVRCTPERLNSTVPAWEAGSLDALFASWATDPKFRQWEPRVVSSPGMVHGAEHDGPWIMTFDSFVSDFEVGQLIRGGRMGGFERSTDQGKIVGSSGEREKVTSRTRTSSNAWCRAECEALPGVQSVSKRIEEVTGTSTSEGLGVHWASAHRIDFDAGIPEKNYESFQILKYEGRTPADAF